MKAHRRAQMNTSHPLTDVHSNFNMSACACICVHIRPYQQWIVVGWPQGCVPGWRLLLVEYTQGILLVAIGLARGRNGWDIWLTNQPETFSLQPLRREREKAAERQGEWRGEVRVCDWEDALVYKVAEHCLRPIQCETEGGTEAERDGARGEVRGWDAREEKEKEGKRSGNVGNICWGNRR